MAAYIGESKEQNEFSIVFTGNCSAAALGILSEEYSGSTGTEISIVPTSLSGFLYGMALSTVTGNCWTELTENIPGYMPMPEENSVDRAHDLDPLEESRLRDSSIAVISAEMLRRNNGVLTFFPTFKSVYLHIDLDILDPSFVKVNSFAAPGELLPEELFSIVFFIKKKYNVSAIAFTSCDPAMDREHKVQQVINQLVKIVIE